MYTLKNWKAYLNRFRLTNKDVALEFNMSPQNVKQETSPKRVEAKGLPVWAHAALVTWYRLEPIEALQAMHDQEEAQETNFEKAIRETAENEPAPLEKLIEGVYGCGCSVAGGLFRRNKECKVKKESHKFQN